MPVYTAGSNLKPAEIAMEGLKEAQKKNVDVVIMDTAGRLQVTWNLLQYYYKYLLYKKIKVKVYL